MTAPASDLHHRAIAGDGSDLPSPLRATATPEVRRQLRRIAKLEAKRPEWLTPPANDNQAWPLAQQLRKEGNDTLLRVAERYRAIYDAATADIQLVGTSLSGDDVYQLDRRTYVKDDGTVVSLGIRKARPKKGERKGADPEKKPVTFQPRQPRRITKKWTGDDMVNAALDSRKVLWLLQEELGHLLGAFEDAVLHGETLSAIGERKGGNTVSSGPIGRAYVMDGLEIVRREFSIMDRSASP